MIKKQYQQGNAFLPYLILVVIAGLITTNLWLYFWSQKEITPSQPQTVDTTTDPLADWQTYKNTTYDYSIRYPKDYKLSDNKERVKLTSGNYLGAGAYTLSLDVYDGINVKNYTTDELISMKWAQAGFSQPYPSGYLNKQTVKIGENTFTSFTVASGMDSVTEYFISHNNILYRITDQRLGSSVNNADQKILSTFRFTDDMSDWQTYNTTQYGLQFKFPSDLVYIGPEGGEIIGPLSSPKAIKYAPDLVVGTPANELLFTLDIIPTSENDGNFYVLNHIQQVFSRDTSKYSKSTASIDNIAYDKYSRLQNRQPDNHTQIKDVYTTSQNGFTYIITLYDLQTGEKILSTFQFTNGKIIPETYTNAALGFSIQHPVGWNVDATSTPNKVWFNKTESEAVDSIEVKTGALASWDLATSGDVTNLQNLTIDGYPAKQIDLLGFNLQMTAIEKDGKLYIITSNRDIKKLGLVSTFHFTK